ncbi:hypothetical protein N780_07645 [Pontibacillus chungwhensis BH030062]|uniref:Pycsar effector protein domain-containing protein n=1 Tax=Pontibacillus chungwhensis BH030062 TaxID=1385513 RepID=A0A0A2V8B4_9BACI|nr:Pycsar system effector family protein [Pontibacillus chungwhensis]KGP89950.1 hypothetical protein N780_07645 [Pontibacillus chungwhensis BH030062]
MDKVDFAKHHNTYISDYIKFADAKSLAIVTINGLIIRVLFTNIGNISLMPVYISTLISCGLLILGVIFAARVILPRTSNKNEKGLIFWGNVSSWEKDAYVNEVIEIHEKNLLQKLIEQNYFLAKTATSKYNVLRQAFIITFIGLSGLVVSGVLWLVLNC